MLTSLLVNDPGLLRIGLQVVANRGTRKEKVIIGHCPWSGCISAGYEGADWKRDPGSWWHLGEKRGNCCHVDFNILTGHFEPSDF